MNPAINRDWVLDTPLSDVISGCPKSCKAKIQAPALAKTACKTHILPVNYSNPVNTKQVDQVMSLDMAPPLDRQAFLIASSLVEDGSKEKLNLVTGYTTENDCVGNLNYTVCTLESAIAEYDVSIDDGKMTLDSPGTPTILALANNTGIDHKTHDGGYHHSTMSIIALQIWDRWDSYAANYILHGEHRTFYVSQEPTFIFSRNVESECHTFDDPHETVIESINKLMVYIGAAVAKEDQSYLKNHMDSGLSINSTVTGDVVGNHIVYHTDFKYFIAAALVELACILLVAPTYWGWWRLGRPGSFSPLEIAKVSIPQR